jgi:nicotinamide riboside kinase
MRIAIAGAHSVGKTTLAEELAARLEGYEFIEEPYHQMVDEGYEFPEVPSGEDFFEQLKVWKASIQKSGDSVIFDRSPLDFYAYALSLRPHEPFDKQELIELCQEALEDLDLIIFCPVEEPDRIGLSSQEDRKLRSRVDHALRELLLDDSLGLLGHLQLIEVSGTVERRLGQVLPYLK